MTQAEAVQSLRERVARHPGPMVSVYLSVNNALPENQKQGYLLRLKEGLKNSGAPEGLARKVREFFESERPRGRTTILFADEDDLFEVYRLHIDLPEEIRWGEPFTVPLALALDEYERYGIALLDGERFRFFVTTLGDIEEPLEEENPIDTAGWRELTIPTSTEAPQGGASKDDFQDRVEEQIRRFYSEMADATRQMIGQHNIRRLILAGPRERTAEFRRALPQDVEKRVVADAAIPTGASESDVMERISTVREEAERRHEDEQLAEAREKGVRGLDATLSALQEGQLYVLLAPWPIEGEVRWDDTAEMAITDLSRETSPYSGEPTRVRQLADVLLELAEKRGARVEFVRGEKADTVLRDEFGGLAGLRRF
jgi:peptide subunit release factor 1 (eRF1)